MHSLYPLNFFFFLKAKLLLSCFHYFTKIAFTEVTNRPLLARSEEYLSNYILSDLSKAVGL